jgi:hypothetical protein
VLGSTPKPDGAFVVQAVRGLLGKTDAFLREGRILLCDRDPNGTSAMEAVLSTVGVRMSGHRQPRELHRARCQGRW